MAMSKENRVPQKHGTTRKQSRLRSMKTATINYPRTRSTTKLRDSTNDWTVPKTRLQTRRAKNVKEKKKMKKKFKKVVVFIESMKPKDDENLIVQKTREDILSEELTLRSGKKRHIDVVDVKEEEDEKLSPFFNEHTDTATTSENKRRKIDVTKPKRPVGRPRKRVAIVKEETNVEPPTVKNEDIAVKIEDPHNDENESLLTLLSAYGNTENLTTSTSPQVENVRGIVKKMKTKEEAVSPIKH